MKTAAAIEPILIDNRKAFKGVPADLAQLQFLARLMDSAFEIPGLKIRFGLDSLIGLIPGFGDFATSFVTLYILQEAHRRGVSRVTLGRMGFNILVDWLVGSVPFAGDAFDIFWKSNQKNVALLMEHEANPPSSRKKNLLDWLFLMGMIGGLITVLVGSLTMSYLVVSWLVRSLWPA